ncbi:MAG TPA: FAD-binding oxidoreductase [Gemmatimonadaceae bacterium]|nr:FAD-binding oxidoreductase [Gemmatimonadaceae bacterium]
MGLGGSGLTCIRELQALGARVVGIDAGAIAGGAAGRNGGFLLAGTADFHHDAVERLGRERAVALYRLTLNEMARIVAESPGVIHLRGSLRIADSDDELEDCRRQLRRMNEDGLLAEWYSGPEGDGLLIPGDGAFNPLARARGLARMALADGARLFGDTPVHRVERGVVCTSRGTVHCAHVIVAVDGRLEQLLPELSGTVRTARLQMLGTAPAREVSFRRPVYARYGFDYWQQLEDGRVVLGGGRDRVEEVEWTTDATPSASVQEYLEALLRDRLSVSAPITHRWAASVAYSRDGSPVLDEVRPGVWAIGAYSGTGNVMGALYGRAVARLVSRGDGRLASILRA